MSLFWILLIVAIYLLGAAFTWQKMKDSKNSWFEKAYYSVLWPLTLLLYGIYVLHNKM